MARIYCAQTGKLNSALPSIESLIQTYNVEYIYVPLHACIAPRYIVDTLHANSLHTC